ncbi:MAG: hypothetical protein RIR26_2387 [Pseudomonadota bacterium]|jgi:HAD superfamily hydrolase (TIGR01484 family)
MDWSGVRTVATDIDGTLTTSGVFTPDVLRALFDLNAAGFQIVLVTGRPSGWVQGLTSYLPVHAAIAENGGVVFLGKEAAPHIRVAESGSYLPFAGADQRGPLEAAFSKLKQEHPHLRVTEDNTYRLSDYTFHVDGLSQEQLSALKIRVEQEGFSFTWSTIHAHIMPRGQDKSSALRWLLERGGLAHAPADTTLTIGDSPNDGSLFQERFFPLSAGVANILKYRSVMEYFPKKITSESEGRGFVEIANELLGLKKGQK